MDNLDNRKAYGNLSRDIIERLRDVDLESVDVFEGVFNLVEIHIDPIITDLNQKLHIANTSNPRNFEGMMANRLNEK